MRAPALLLLALAAAPTVAAAQVMRALGVERQHHGETRLDAVVRFAAGDLTVVPATPGTLYDFDLTYDRDRWEPRTTYEPATGRLVLGVERVGGGGLRVSTASQLAQRATLALSAAVDLDLSVELDAGEGRLELGGLRLGSLSVNSGASRTTVHWSRANPGACSEAAFRAGAAELVVEGLGYSGCRRVLVDGGVGTITLDLTGPWRHDAEVGVRVTMGGVRLRLPEGLGVRLTLDRLAASFQPEGFEQRDGAWQTPGYDEATRKVTLEVASRVGGVEVVWVRGER